MQEKIKGIWEKIRQRWTALSKKIKVLIGAVAAVTVIAIAVVVAMSMNQSYVVLYSGMSQSDVAAAMSYLSENGVTDVRMQGEDTILVPEEQADQLRVNLALSGNLNSGFAYDTYLSNVGSLTTESERRELRRFEVQDRLAATLRLFPKVKEATVNIIPREENSYILDKDNSVAASINVTLVLEDGEKLNDQEASAVYDIVRTSWSGLTPENIVVKDTAGNNYTDGDELASVQSTSELKLRFQRQINEEITSKVLRILEPLYGAGNVTVGVNSVVDVDRTFTDSTNYSREEGPDGQPETIIGTEIWNDSMIRGEAAAAGGAVGTTTNADISTVVENQMEGINGDETLLQSSGQNNNLVDTEQTQREQISARIADVMVSVTINADVAGDTNVASLREHIARAAGIGAQDQDDKVSVLIAAFYQEPVLPEAPSTIEGWILYAAIAGVVLFIILLVVILLIRRAKKRRLARLAAEAEAAEADQLADQPADEGADIMNIDNEKSMELRQDVRKFAEDNPEIAAQMIKSWLREGEESK